MKPATQVINMLQTGIICGSNEVNNVAGDTFEPEIIPGTGPALVREFNVFDNENDF
jgi:hypothetical protein